MFSSFTSNILFLNLKYCFVKTSFVVPNSKKGVFEERISSNILYLEHTDFDMLTNADIKHISRLNCNTLQNVIHETKCNMFICKKHHLTTSHPAEKVHFFHSQTYGVLRLFLILILAWFTKFWMILIYQSNTFNTIGTSFIL